MPEEKKEPTSAKATEGKEKTASPKDVEENKVIAAIGYLGILFLVPLLAKKDSPFAQYHAKQGMVLFIAMIVAQLGWIIYWVPILGWLVAMIVYIFLFVCLIMGLVNALGGKMSPLPLFGKWGESIKI